MFLNLLIYHIIPGFVGGTLIVYFLTKWGTKQICEGSHSIKGCRKKLYIINRHIFFKNYGASITILLCKLTGKDTKNIAIAESLKNYHIFRVFRNAQYETIYCCPECFEKHEAYRIADLLTEEEVDEDSYTLVHGHHV